MSDSEQQHIAARNLIAQMVSNSDVHGDDAIEEQRRAPGGSGSGGGGGTSGASEEALAAAAARQAELQRRQEAQYARPSADSDLGPDELAAADPLYRDEVQEAFDNYGQITQEILDEWKEMFQLFESVAAALSLSLF